MMDPESLEILWARVHRLRHLCNERGVDLASRHHTDVTVEAVDLAAALGSPWPEFATDPRFPDRLLGVEGENPDDLRPLLAEHLAG